MNDRIATATRTGFTIIEALITLALIVLVLGIVVPAVIDQLESDEPTRIAQDLESIRSAVRLFRVDVKRFPGTPEQLVVAPDAWVDSTDLSGSAIPAPLLDDWSGPYLEMGSVIEGGSEPDTLRIALGIEADAAFGVGTYRGDRWLTLGFDGITALQTQRVSDVIDGHTNTADEDAGGRVRWDEAAGRMLYFVLPLD
ncbi:MAG: type II secretion system protein [Candidatus Longimicrobiales bacterium M2_2A_002]